MKQENFIRRNLKLVCLICMICTVAAVMYGCNIGKNSTSELSEIQPSSSVSSEAQPSVIDGKIPIRLYFADTDNCQVKKEIRYVEKESASKSVNNLCAVIVNELLLGPDPALGISTPYFGSVIMNGDVAIDSASATATIDLSQDFTSCAKGDEQIEKLIINTIVNSLTEVKEIQSVKINIDGKKNECMKSGLSLGSAFNRDESVLQANGASPSPGMNQSVANGNASDEQVANASNTMTNGLYDNE